MLNGGAVSVMINCFAFFCTDKDTGHENIISLTTSVLPKPWCHGLKALLSGPNLGNNISNLLRDFLNIYILPFDYQGQRCNQKSVNDGGVGERKSYG